jgi:hypothetical protein
MKEQITKMNDNLIINLEIPLKSHRHNPYDDKENLVVDNIVGVIDGDEIGFAYWIDMSYKGKEDQISILFYLYNGEEGDFIKLCRELGIYVHKYESCDYCMKSIYGSYLLADKGKMCYSCEYKLKEK